ncbi:KAP family P-loop NTPase fold protein [Ruminococcus flavefaciens]|uniref:KAP family P-loop NTPase fold protein n=1 Tax=Ruminococcus flavefaciens TaxID=1265 RepID=UPI0002D2C9E2|nr:P-loop NTPase fold protein [Ruminococcus flavefaciens]
MFLTDLPIEKIDNDLLGRGIFAHRIAESILNYKSDECLTIGIYGGWGDGKTSLANMVLNEIIEKDNDSSKPNYCIIRFNPWLFANQKDLITQLFSSISEAFKYSDPNSIKEKLADSISWIGKAAKVVGHIPVISTIANDISVIFDDYSKMLKGEDTDNDEYKSLSQLKFKISETLKEEEIKLIVSIDDFDRLSQEEIRLMFQVVKVLGDFNNTIYLLSFDKAVVVDSLKDVQGGDGDDYLKKIIQVPITLPLIRKDVIKEITLEKFNSIINFSSLSDNDKLRINNLSDSLFKVLSSYISNIRDINRLINLFEFKYGFIKDEINPVDLLALCAIEVFKSDEYKQIVQFKDDLSKIKIDLDLYKFISEKKAAIWNNFDKTGFNNCFVQNDKFDLFFSFTLPDQYINSSEKDQIIFYYDLSTIEKIIDSHINDIPGLVDSIQRKFNEIKQERCPIIFQILEMCFLKSRVSINSKITPLILNLISRFSQNEIEQSFSNFENSHNKKALVPFYTNILFYLKQADNSIINKLFKELVFDTSYFTININNPPDIDLEQIEKNYLIALSDINIFEFKEKTLQKLYLLCKTIDINYLKKCIPSDYAENDAAISILGFEIEGKVEETKQGQQLIYYVNMNEIEKLLDIPRLYEHLKKKENLSFNIFLNNDLSEKIKAFLICEDKEPNSEGICKVYHEKELQKMSFEAFFG